MYIEKENFIMSTSSFIAPTRVGNSIICSQNIPPDSYTELYSFGSDSNHFSNLAYLSTKHLSFASASALHIIDSVTGTKTTIPSFAMGGVTCVATTGDGSHLAVGLASEEIGARVLIFRIAIDQPENPVHLIEDPQLLEFVEKAAKAAKVDQSQTDSTDEEPLLPPIEVNSKLFLVHEVTLSNIGKLGIESLAFNHDSTLLAVVSSGPDYLLSVLNWAQRRLLLKAPAFTSPVYRVSFCKYTTDGLITGGRTHLKFWKMAQTFTGVKLQGELAKFGILDSSDCTAFIELPSGNILSGCGTGEIVLWDSSTVRLVFQRPGGKKCHEGRIEYMSCDLDGLFTRGATSAKQDDDTALGQPLTTHPPTLLYHSLLQRGVPPLSDNWAPQAETGHSLAQGSSTATGEQREKEPKADESAVLRPEVDEESPLTLLPVIITAGSDGYIRLWSGHQLLQAQFLDNNDSVFFEITPVEEIYIGHGACIRNMVLSPDSTSMAMQDAGIGGITLMDIASRSIRRICYSHGGPVKSIACVNSSSSLILSGINNDINNLNIRSPLVATVGNSGVVFMHDLASRRIVSAKKSASGKGTKLLFIHNGVCLVVGYSDGSVRFFSVYYDTQDYAGNEATSEEVPTGILDTNDCLFLIAAYKCFSDAVVDITCSQEGVVAILSASGRLFLIQTTLSLIRRGLGNDVALAQDGQEHMSSLAKGLLNVRDTAEDESQKKAFELAVMASSGIFGMTGKDILPLGEFDIYHAIFKESPDKLPQRLGHLFYLEPNVIAMAVLNCTSPEDRLVAITLPLANDLIQYRLRSGSSTTDDLSSTTMSSSAPHAEPNLLGEPSSVSYNLMHMFNSVPYFLSIAIPVTPLPGTCEGTIAKVEHAVVQRKISAMLPSRGAMESAMDALLAMEMTEEKQEEESTESEEEYDEEGNKIEGKKKKKLNPNDPLYEDMNQPQKFDFVQFSFVNGAGLVKPDGLIEQVNTEEAVELPTPGTLAVLVKIFIDEEIRNRAESAMASVRARAEASGATASNIAAGDPALFCAALAVAEARASYRSSLVYLFDYALIKKSFFSLINANAIGSRSLLMNSGITVTTDGNGEEPTGALSKKIFIRPEIISPAAHRGPLMDAPALKEAELDDVEFEPQNSKSINLLMRAPIMSFPVKFQSLGTCVTEDTLNKELLSAERSGPAGKVFGALFTIQSGGSITVEPYRTENEFTILTQNVLKGEASNLNPLVAMQLVEQKSEWWTAYCAQAVPNNGLCCMNMGFGGHVCVIGDMTGNILVYGTHEAKALLARLQTAYLATGNIKTFDNGLCTRYVRDNIYSTGIKGFKPSVSLVFHEKVFSLVSKAIFKEKAADILKQQPDAIPLEGDDLDQQAVTCDYETAERPVEVDGASKFLTLEQARLSELDSAASKLGQDGKHAVLLKIQGLRALYDTLVKENAALPLEKRLYPHEISPDLLLAHDWVGREERRAHTIIYDELGDILRGVTAKIQSVLANFPVTEFIYTVRAFANPAFQVTTFKLYPFSKKFEDALCEALGIDSLDELDQLAYDYHDGSDYVDNPDALSSTKDEANIMNPDDTVETSDASDNSIIDNDQRRSLNQTTDSRLGTTALASLSTTKKSLGESSSTVAKSALAPLKSSRTMGSSRLGSVAGTRTIKAIDKIIAQTLSNKLGETTMKQNELDDTISDAQIKQQRVLQRVEARQKRKEELRMLLAEKPDPNKISPEDEKAYDFSLETFGQFPLKTTEEYVSKVGQLTQQCEDANARGKQAPPVNVYENKEGRWLQFLLAIKGLHDAQKDFNNRVAVLFACKQAVVESVNTLKKEALRITASIKHMAGHLIAADIDARLAKYEFSADPDKLLSMISLHPDEIAHIRRMEVHDRYIRNWASCKLAETPLNQIDNTTLCLQLQSCYSQASGEFFKEGDLTGSDSLSLQYLEFCVANKIISSEEADRLQKLLGVPATGIQSAVHEIVLSSSEALGGLRYGTLPKLSYLLRNETNDSNDDSDSESGKISDEDEDEDELINMCQPYINTAVFTGVQGLGSAIKQSSSILAINDSRGSDTDLQHFSTGGGLSHNSAAKSHPLAKDVLLYSGYQIQEATSVRPITVLAAENAQYAPSLYNKHDSYDITSTLAQHNNVQMNVLQGTQNYDSTKAISIFSKMQVSYDYAQKTRYWVSLALYCRSQIINKMLSLATAFDNAVRQLQYSSVQLKMDFARMRIRIISLFQQTEIHHLYITRDAKSMEHLENCKNEHRQITIQLEQLRKQISQKTEEAMAVGANLQKLLREFNNSISIDAPFRTKLIKIYNKKYRAPKPIKPQTDPEQSAGLETTVVGGGTAKKALGSTNPDDYMEESDESSELSNLSEGGVEDDDEPVDETVAPEGVSNELFNFVLNLRSKKRDYDAQLASIHQEADQLKQQYLILQKKEKAAVSATDAANRELTQFRAGKQKELNSVQTAALVTMGQYAYMSEDDTIIEDLSNALLFDAKAIHNLKDRIDLRKKQLRHFAQIGESLKDTHYDLLQKEKQAQKDYKIYSEKLEAVQMLKFGQLVDIAKLDNACINEQAEELTRILNQEELEFKQDQLYKETILERGRDQLKYALDKNTELVLELARLERESLDLDRAILDRQRKAPKAWCSDNKQELVRQEYNSLKQEIINRERELRTLVDEIAILKNHGS